MTGAVRPAGGVDKYRPAIEILRRYLTRSVKLYTFKVSIIVKEGVWRNKKINQTKID